MRWARSTRTFLVVSVLLGSITSILVIGQAWLLADAICAVFLDGADLATIWPDVWALTGIVVARAAVAFGLERAAFQAAARAKSQLRMAVLSHLVELGPAAVAQHGAGELTQLTSRGIDALDAYFARYLPQLVLAVIVPLTVGLTILTRDLMAAVIVACTLPLIPIFMILIGRYTQVRVERQWRSLGLLAGHFLDVVAGLPTLKAFGRARAQATTLRQIGDRYRGATMGVLRVSFLSSLVLELLATLSVAIVAVSIGLRIVNGTMDLRSGLIVLILAPEVYLPLRLVGTHYHAAAEGIAASSKLLDVLDEPVATGNATGNAKAVPPDPSRHAVVARAVTLAYPHRPTPAVRDFTATFPAGRVTALIGPSGAGKSTLLRALLGFQEPQSGTIALEMADGEVSIRDFDSRRWLERVAWLPQDPTLIAGTVADNIRLGSRDATEAQVRAAAREGGLIESDLDTTALLDREVGERGAGLSAGQCRRVALARVLLRDAPLVLLDEPSANLDSETEQIVVRAVQGLGAEGRTVIVVAHRSALVDIADQVVEVPPPDDPDLNETAFRDSASDDSILPGLRR